MKRTINTITAMVAIMTLGLVSCRKNNLAVDTDIAPPAFAKFNRLVNTDTLTRYFVTEQESSVKLAVGVTNVENRDRTINFTYVSNTAVQGQQFTAPTSMVIRAGQALDTLVFKGIYGGFASASRVDTVDIIISGDVPSSAYNGKHRIILRKSCPVVLNDFLGTYANTNEVFGSSAYGPYTTTISAVQQLTPTTGTITVTNIYDYGWNPITFKLDWTNPDPTKHTVTLAQQTGIGDAGTLSATYAGQDITVRPFAGQTGTFSSCNQIITIRMQVGVTGGPFFSSLYTINLAR